MFKKIAPVLFGFSLLAIPAKASFWDDNVLNPASKLRKGLRLAAAAGLASYGLDRSLRSAKNLKQMFAVWKLPEISRPLPSFYKRAGESAIWAAVSFLSAYKIYKSV